MTKWKYVLEYDETLRSAPINPPWFEKCHMNGESKVIAFEKLQNKQGARHSLNKVFIEGRSIFIGGVAERIARLFAKTDDELFRLSERAGNDSLQSLYFNGMRYLRRERGGVQEHYLRELTGVYEAFWRNKPFPSLGQKKTSRDRGELTLLADEVLEESLAINGMVEKGNALFGRELYALDRRFMALLGKPGEMIEINPVSPLALCRLFASSLVGLSLDLEIKLLIYKMFDRHVLSLFGPVYHKLNVQMVKAGILPSLPGNGQVKRPGVEDVMAARSAQRRAKEKADKLITADRMDAFETMRGLLEAWRCRSGLPAQPADHRAGVVMAHGAQVISILGLLQRRLATGGRILSSEEMKRLIAGHAANSRADGKASVLDRQVEDVIDMVGMVFVYILEDPRLPSSIKAMLASLQIPILKIALLERSFFAKANHPARLLLNGIAQASVGLDGELDADSPVYQKIESIVGRILADLGRDVGLLYDLLEDFTAFMAVEHRRIRAAEERTRQATQSKEQIRQAKRAVAHVMVSRLSGVAAPAILKSFLYNAWKDVLVLAWLRLNKDPDNWHGAIALMDQLIGGMAAVDGPADQKAMGQMDLGGAPLLDAMRCRLENLAYEQYWMMELLKELELCLEARSHGFPSSARFAFGAASMSPEEVGIMDPEFAALISEIEGNLRDGAGLCEEGADLSEVAGDRACASVPAESPHVDEDEFFGKASSLGIGQWVEFMGGHCKLRRAKLSWKNSESDVYVFVNAKGAKFLEMKRVDLACCFRDGSARTIEDQRVPLMDRAFYRLMQFLQSPSSARIPLGLQKKE